MLTLLGGLAVIAVIGLGAVFLATDIMIPVGIMLIVAGLVHEVFHG
ncbi:hypothetical protein KBX73_04690 [Acetobacter persici]|nr:MULTISPECIES: hypothetical protein [Acetobacter]MCG4261200.1 hypothetical protein [Acetobacter senegalensis]MCP9319085.1 hypothetical protein [Acetobacter persici]CCT58412.1 hypothetical protein APA386B_293 [Acetobacter pasteurianus 386B]